MIKKSLLILISIFCLESYSRINVEYYKMENGLQVLLYPEDQAPTVACRLFYTTGSVHEHPGQTGIAHMLEHMLFKGTKKIGITDSSADMKYLPLIDKTVEKMNSLDPTADSATYLTVKTRYDSLLTEYRKYFIKDELWETYLKEGGTGLNAFTSDLMTAYFVSLPKNKLELFLWLESDRMQNAVLREFYPERDVVLEERKMRVEDSPYGRYTESLNSMFYEAHPFRNPTIGHASDIKNYSRNMAEEHYRKYYKPNNAILVLAGDFDPPDARKLINKYFKDIPKGEELAKIVTREPEPAGEKRLTVYKDAAKPRIDMLFLTPEIGHDDIYALDILEGVLSGKTGRLYKSLVKEKKIAVSASGSNRVDVYHSSFHINIALGPKPETARVEKAVWEILEELKNKEISVRELQQVKNQVAAQSLRKLESLEHLATELAFYQMWGTWEYINIFPESVDKITAQDVRRVCKKYFQKNRMTIGTVLPENTQVN